MLRKNNGIFYVAISLVAVFALVVVVNANVSLKQLVANAIADRVSNSYTNQTEDDVLGVQSGTDLTVDNLTYGPARSVRLNFSAGATTTPGALGRIYNSGPAKVCSKVELDITTGSTTGGALGGGAGLAFSVTTSTGRTVGNGVGLIATTTLPTSTTNLLNNVDDAGTNGQDSWVLGQGEYILAQFDTATDVTASSTAYTTMAGYLYVDCHERN